MGRTDVNESPGECAWSGCGSPATENRSCYEQRWFMNLIRRPDKEHPLWFCPKHARWHDHPEEIQSDVPPPWFEDGIKVTEVDVEFDYDSLGDHAPNEQTVEELAREGAASIRVRFWRVDPHQNGYQSYDLAGCDVVEALVWATKRITTAGDEFEGGEFQLGVYTPAAEDSSGESGDENVAQVAWLYGDHPFHSAWSDGSTEWGWVDEPKSSFDLETLRLLSGAAAARRIWGEHVYGMKAGHQFAGCAACEMAIELGFTRQ